MNPSCFELKWVLMWNAEISALTKAHGTKAEASNKKSRVTAKAFI